MPDWISVEESAELSGYSQEYIRRLIRTGRLVAQKKGLMWWVDKASLTWRVTEACQSLDQRRLL